MFAGASGSGVHGEAGAYGAALDPYFVMRCAFRVGCQFHEAVGAVLLLRRAAGFLFDRVKQGYLVYVRIVGFFPKHLRPAAQASCLLRAGCAHFFAPASGLVGVGILLARLLLIGLPGLHCVCVGHSYGMLCWRCPRLSLAGHIWATDGRSLWLALLNLLGSMGYNSNYEAFMQGKLQSCQICRMAGGTRVVQLDANVKRYQGDRQAKEAAYARH